MDLKHKHVLTLTFLNDKHINFTNYGISIVLLEVSSLWKFVFHSPNTTGIKLISLDPDINNKMWKDPDKNTLQPSAPCPPVLHKQINLQHIKVNKCQIRC